MSESDWNTLFERGYIVGGDLEVRLDDVILRGPITRVTFSGASVVVNRAWVAQYDPYQHPRWTHHSGADEVRLRFDVNPEDMDDGSVQFELHHGKGTAVLHPKGCGRGLRPEHVVGLKL